MVCKLTVVGCDKFRRSGNGEGLTQGKNRRTVLVSIEIAGYYGFQLGRWGQSEAQPRSIALTSR